jgi:Arc/MetJ-type ribon-helix-helix transcriptional regulator
MRHITAEDLPENIARLAEAQVTAGRFASVEDVVCAGVEALAERAEADADWLVYARVEATSAFAELDEGRGVATTPEDVITRLDQDIRARGHRKRQ